MSITVPLVMISTTAAGAHTIKGERPAFDAPSIPSSLHHFGPECTFGIMNSECRRKLEGIDFEDEGSDSSDDDMDDPLTIVLPEDITITQHGISESWIDEIVWDKDAMDLFEQIHPRQSSKNSQNGTEGSSTKVKEPIADSNIDDIGNDLDKESMYDSNEEVTDTMTDVDDDGEKIKSESSKLIPSKNSESRKKKSTSKSSDKKNQGSKKNGKDRSNLRKRGQFKLSKSQPASSSTASQDEWVPSHIPTESPSDVSSAFINEAVQPSSVLSDFPSIVPSGAPSFSSSDDDGDYIDDILPTQNPSATTAATTTTTAPTTTGSDTEIDVSVIVVDIDDSDDSDDDGSDSFASPGKLSTMVGLGILVAVAAGLQSYFRRRDSPPSSSDMDDDDDDDMDTVDL